MRIARNEILKMLKDCGHSLRGKKSHLSLDKKHSMMEERHRLLVLMRMCTNPACFVLLMIQPSVRAV